MKTNLPICKTVRRLVNDQWGGKNQIFLNLERYKAMFLQEIYKYNYVYDN